jgi:ribokinase
MKAQRIVVVGSVNTDMVVKSDRIPAPGETVVGGTFMMAAGGKGANQAVAAARLGAQVTLVAKVGRDVFGDQALENFRGEGIATEYIVADPQAATGVALILVDRSGENLISVASGANAALSAADVARADAAIRAADVLLMQLEVPLDTVRCAADLAAAAGVSVILNPAPAAALDDALLSRVTILTPNESEAQRLTGIAVVDEPSALAAGENLLARGVQNVIITMGARGALWIARGRHCRFPAVAVEAVDTTAAGDAFNGSLACGLAAGESLETAIRQGCLAGALAATRLGAQPSLPTAAELRKFGCEDPLRSECQ